MNEHTHETVVDIDPATGLPRVGETAQPEAEKQEVNAAETSAS